jgi:hypothetical protein
MTTPGCRDGIAFSMNLKTIRKFVSWRAGNLTAIAKNLGELDSQAGECIGAPVASLKLPSFVSLFVLVYYFY